MKRSLGALLLLLVIGVFAVSAALAQSPAKSAVDADPVLKAMSLELERSKGKLKLEQTAAPYYIEYRVNDFDQMIAESEFGASRGEVHSRFRFLRVVVRVGDYKQDSFWGQGQGDVELMPLDNDLLSLRHQIWLATDKAYKSATAALTAKQAQLKQFTVEQPVDDFSHAEPVQEIEPLAKLEVSTQAWAKILNSATSLYRSDPQLQNFSAAARFQAANMYLLNSEGSAVRKGTTVYDVSVAANTQAADGTRLDRSHSDVVASARELPSEQQFVSQAKDLVGSLKDLRAAPMADEDFRGPVLFSADAASTLFADFVGENVLGLKPELGQPARTRGAWATSFKTRVLPDFLSVTDDPTLTSVENHALLGHYGIDDEGVKAVKVPVIENGKLINYLVGREPIRDFPASNGHGRTRIPAGVPGPGLGNLVVKSSQALSREEMKKKLRELCQQRDLPFGYYVEAMGPRHTPRVVYKVSAKDGHEELVRGAVFGDLDARAMRNNLVAAGDDLNVDNRVLNIPHSIVSPSVLFDELEVKRTNANKEKLPEYSAPALGGDK